MSGIERQQAFFALFNAIYIEEIEAGFDFELLREVQVHFCLKSIADACSVKILNDRLAGISIVVRKYLIVKICSIKVCADISGYVFVV